MVALAAKRQPGADHRLSKLATGRHSEPAIVKIGADALLGPEHLVPGRLVDQPGDDLAVALQRDRDGEMRDPVEEIGGAVQRVDNPAVMLVGTFRRAAFLEQQAVAGTRLGQLVAERPLGAQIRGGDELTRTLDRDLQLLDFAEIADQPARRFQRGIGHDVQNGRAHRHDGRSLNTARLGKTRRAQSLARSTYVASAVLTTIRVPASICGGIMTRRPFSSLPGL